MNANDQTSAFVPMRGHRLKGNIDDMRATPLAFYTRAQHTHGHYVRISAVPGIHCYLLTHPDAIEHVLYKHHRHFRKPDIFYKAVSLLVGNGLFTSEGELWTRQRKLIQPTFHGLSLSQLTPAINHAVNDFVKDQHNQPVEPIDIDHAMMKLGLRITSTTLFGADISGEADAAGKAFRTAFQHLGRRLNSAQLIPNWLPTPANLRFARAKKLLDKLVLDLITTRRSSRETHNDLLSMLLAMRDPQTGQGIADRQLMDEVLTLLTAGHENIGSALTWTCHLLAAHPAIQEQVHQELRTHLTADTPDAADLAKLPLTRAVFEESMRLYPPGWGVLRESIEPQDIEGHALPGKSLIVLCQWVTHRHPDFWPEPETFKPERFLPGAMAHHRFAYFPFGGGPRVCIGMQLAIMEGILVLAGLLRHFKLTPTDDKPVHPDATFTLRPSEPLKLLLTPR